MDQRLTDFLVKLENTEEMDSAKETVIKFFEGFGIDIFHSWFIDAAVIDNNIKFVTSCPDWWFKYYVENECYLHDPLGLHSAEKITPLWYNRENLLISDLNKTFVDAVAVSKDGFDLESGLIFPIHSSTGSLGGVNAGSSLDKKEFQKAISENDDLLLIASYLAHTKIHSLLFKRSQDEFALTEREKECLLWLGKGLRVDAIAYKLNLARITVDIHLRHAREKLGCGTREQALAKAITMKLIAP